MDFKNDISPPPSTLEEATLPKYTSTTGDPTPSYTNVPHPPRLYWNPARCASRDFILHILSLIFAGHTLAFYIYDLNATLSYHAPVPAGLAVVSALSILASSLAILWSVFYLLHLHGRMKRGEVGRKWPLFVDLPLWALTLGMANTTLSVRTARNNCSPNRDVGGCDASRRGIMIAAGVLGVLLAVSVQLRWIITCHAAREQKRLGVRQRARGEVAFVR